MSKYRIVYGLPLITMFVVTSGVIRQLFSWMMQSRVKIIDVSPHANTYCDIILVNCHENVSKWVRCIFPQLSSWLSLVNYRVTMQVTMQSFAYSTTGKLLGHKQKFIMIWWPRIKWHLNIISDTLNSESTIILFSHTKDSSEASCTDRDWLSFGHGQVIMSNNFLWNVITHL